MKPANIKVYGKVVEDSIKVELNLVKVLEAMQYDLKVNVSLDKLVKKIRTFDSESGKYKNIENPNVVENEKERKVTFSHFEVNRFGDSERCEDDVFWFAPEEWEAFKALRTLITYYKNKEDQNEEK